MTEIANTLDTVGTLLGERARFDGWLRALEDKRSAMPPHVVERVRADYGERLLTVLRALGTHVPALSGAADSLASRDAVLRQDEDARHDARAEAELRHAVGEYDDARWAELKAEHDGVLASLGEERRGIAGELATVRGLLAQAEDAQRVVDAGGPLATMPVTAPIVAVPAPDAVPAETATADAAAEALAGTEGDLAPVPPVSSEGPSADAVAGDRTVPRDAIESATPRSVDPAPAAPLVTPSAPEAAAATATAAPRAADPRKTLKCAECGAMNLPSEWYCEQCGGELAVF
jgi:hypothetical protein